MYTYNTILIGYVSKPRLELANKSAKTANPCQPKDVPAPTSVNQKYLCSHQLYMKTHHDQKTFLLLWCWVLTFMNSKGKQTVIDTIICTVDLLVVFSEAQLWGRPGVNGVKSVRCSYILPVAGLQGSGHSDEQSYPGGGRRCPTPLSQLPRSSWQVHSGHLQRQGTAHCILSIFNQDTYLLHRF